MIKRPTYWLTLLLILISTYGQAQDSHVLPGVLYVKIKSSPSTADASTELFQFSEMENLKSYTPLRKNANGDRQRASVLDGLFKVVVDPSTDIAALCASLHKYANVSYAEPIYAAQLLYVPDDPESTTPNQEYLSVIRAFEAWDVTKGSSDIVIGISDTGLNLTHDDIKSKLYTNTNDPMNGLDDDENGYVDDFQGYDFADNDSLPKCDDSFHGNRVGGLAGAATDNGFGMAGVGFNTMISPLKVYSTALKFINSGYESILYAADNGYDVINLSWGGPNTYSQANQDIITYAAVEKNVVIVAAAGNTPEDIRFYPASYDHVLSVAASNLNDTKASFSTYNYDVDLMAPGNTIYSTDSGNGFAKDNGTSYSAPMVAGAAALVKSVFPDLNSLQIMQQLRVTSDPVYTTGTNQTYEGKLGYGRLNVSNAVRKDSAKSIRLENLVYDNGNGNYAFYGDTIVLSFEAKNYLFPTDSATLSFTSASSHVEIIRETIYLGAMNTLESDSIQEKIFVIAKDTPPGTDLEIKVSITDGSYIDFQYIELTTDPDRLDLNNDQFSITLSGNGDLGFISDGYYNGVGFQWDDQLIAAKMGVAVSLDRSHVSDNFPDSIYTNTKASDFVAISPIRFAHHTTPDLHATSVFRDDSAATPLEIVMEQNTLTNRGANFLIQEYRLMNNATESREGLACSFYLDWEIFNTMQNRSFYDTESKTLITYNLDSSVVVGLLTYYDSLPRAQSLDLDVYNGNEQDVQMHYTDSVKYALAREVRFDSAGWQGNGNNVSVMLTHDSIALAPSKSRRVAYFMGLSHSFEGLAAVMDSARQVYEEYLNLPVLLERYVSCQGASVSIAPASGEVFRFFSDPLGENIIGEGDTLKTGAIVSDTTFYVANLDSGYEGSIQRIEIALLAQIADFQMSTDTLFLDNSVNSVTFTDLSFDPASWYWDFDNGSQITTQNATVYFRDPGVYTISLTIETNSGCTQTITKELLVANRPPLPDIEDQQVCADQDFTVSAPNADSIAVYLDGSSPTPLQEGPSITLEGISSDTAYYFTNTSGPFESLRKRVYFSINHANATFEYLPDTLNEATGVLFINTSPESASAQWYVDGLLKSELDTFYMEVRKASYEITLSITNTTGCANATTQSVTFATSPLPMAENQLICTGSNLLLEPNNGEWFAFYANEALSHLIKKGRNLTIAELKKDTMIYVTGLDSILPSAAIPVEITVALPQFSIIATPDTLYLSEQSTTSFSTNNDELIGWDWYIDNTPTETTSHPILYFDTEGVYDIVLNATGPMGCTNSDTLKYPVYQSRPEVLLGVDDSQQVIYPNPTTGDLFIVVTAPTEVTISDVSGRIMQKIYLEESALIDLNHLPKDIYLLTLKSQKEISNHRVIFK
ncbi:S8 family serine peptidase [Marinoscillum luteum]|uniref:S8 family serine peptidase n=2 Tax=Marinoscillum luteum TaxID=861051 RepID=A0ABW7N7U3_9BACT